MTLIVKNFSKRYGGLVAVNDVCMTAERSQITAIIGPNGAGKTTLLNLISGVVVADFGRMELMGRDATRASPHELATFGLTRTYQTPQLFHEMSVLETVMVGAHLRGRTNLVATLFRVPSVRREELQLERIARKALERVGLDGALLERNATDLAYGLQRRVEIARALATGGKFILLDEPAAGLNSNETDEISQLITNLAAEGYGIVLVEHDMELVMGLSDKIIVMNLGSIIGQGAPEIVQNDANVIEAYLGSDSDE